MTPGPRTGTDNAQLARLGYHDPARARALLAQLPAPESLAAAAARAAEPDLALEALARLLAQAPDDHELRAVLGGSDEGARERLLAVLGASAALGEHLRRHPGHWRDLVAAGSAPPDAGTVRARLLARVGADPADAEPVAGAGMVGVAAADALRVGYRRQLLGLAARDLTGNPPVEEVAAGLADLAGAVLEAALAVARAELPPDAPRCRLAVVAMGKCGGRELNYASDVDVLFVAEPAAGSDGSAGEQAALRTAVRLAARVMQLCSGHTAEGTVWPVDAGLRPEGRNGPLVRTLASHLTYYRRWAKTWEFQALLKARPVAGDLALGRRYVEEVTPLVWSAADRADFVEDVQAMRRRVVEHIPGGQADRELKLGPGGLRDVEFAVQLLQLVHGRGDETLRQANTLAALEALTAGGYVGRADGARLAAAYRFLRSLEHRLQLYQLRRTHLLPDRPEELRRLGRSLGLTGEPVAALSVEWKRHTQQVRRLHEQLFYRPLLAAVARIPGDEARLTPDAARARLTALGYADPGAALRHIEALTSGVSRRAAIQKTLLPAMLGWFADAPDPDAGLLAFRQVSDALGGTHWYLRLLRDGGAAAEHMAHLLASSRYAVELLRRAPEAVAMLADETELTPRTGQQLATETGAAAGRYDDPVQAVAAVRAVRRRELFRIAAADLLGRLPVEGVGAALTDLATATVNGALLAVTRWASARRGGGPLPARIAVVGLGRFGGHEMGYGSDADVVYVYEPEPGASDADAGAAALEVATRLRELLASPGADPPLRLDADLRPEGRNGPLVRSRASYAAYYARWSSPWEAQALLRAAPVGGDPEVGARFCGIIDRLRWPVGGLSDADVREIRRIKARVDAERLPRGADPSTHTKLGRGGLTDVEWTVQLLQLRHAAAVPGLRTTRTLEALRAAVSAGLLDRADAHQLSAAWQLATRARNAVMLVRARPSDSLPAPGRELAAVARLLGYGPGESGRLVEDYRRTARRARAVVDRLFWE